MVEGWQGSGYRTRTAFGHAVQVSTPRVHCCTFLSIGRAIWFLALVANGATNPPKPKLPRLVSPWGDHAIPFRAAWAGRRIYADFGTIDAFQSQSRVSTWLPFISRGKYVFLIRREQNHRTTGFRPTAVDATWRSLSGQASPEDARMGRRIDEFSAHSYFSPSRTQRPLLVSVRIHHVRSPVVKALSIP